MKRMLLLAISLLGLAGIVKAACVGPYCFDDTGAAIQAGVSMPLLTLSQINTTSPTGADKIVGCTDCVRSAICVASGTAAGSYVVIAATGAFTGATHSGMQHCQ